MPAPNYLGIPKDPKTCICEWCDDTASKAFELPSRKAPRTSVIGRAVYLYVCPKHYEHAERAIEGLKNRAT